MRTRATALAGYLAWSGLLTAAQNSGTPSWLTQSTKPYVYVNGDLDDPADRDFPPAGHLGFGLDMTRTSPLDIREAIEGQGRSQRLLALAKTTRPEKLPGSDQQASNDAGKIWNVPTNAHWNTDNHNAFDALNTFDRGSSAARRLALTDSIGGSYRAIEGGVSVSASLAESLSDDLSWAFYAYVYDVVTVSLDYQPAFNEDIVLHVLEDLPKWPEDTPPTDDTARLYRDAFGNIGTHIITSTTYGSRLELRVTASNSDAEVTKNFKADVEFALQGLPSAGKFDGSVKGSSQYAEFLKTSLSSIWCRGGDSIACSQVKDNLTSPDSYKNLRAWEATAQMDPDLTSLGVVDLWTIVRGAQKPELRDREIDLQKAFAYLVERPLNHYTACAIVTNAPWGEIVILSPRTEIVEVQFTEPRLGVIEWSQGRLKFRTNGGETAPSVRVEFKIRNAGSPFRIALGHGSNGYAGRKASVEFIAAPQGLPEFNVTNAEEVPGDPDNRVEYAGIPADPRGIVGVDENATPSSPSTWGAPVLGGTGGFSGSGPGSPPPWPPANGSTPFALELPGTSGNASQFTLGTGDVMTARKSRKERRV